MLFYSVIRESSIGYNCTRSFAVCCSESAPAKSLENVETANCFGFFCLAAILTDY